MQNPKSFDTNIYEGENIVLAEDDTNQYYMIFHLGQLKNAFETTTE